MADLSMALEGRFSSHHAMMCQLQLDRIAAFDREVAGLDERIAAVIAPWEREVSLLKTIPGSVTSPRGHWIAEIGPPRTSGSLLRQARLLGRAGPGNHVSAGKRGYGRTGDSGTWIKPVLVQCAWSAMTARAAFRPATGSSSAAWAAVRAASRGR
jgi:transposase